MPGIVPGQAHNKANAVAAAEKAIDRALAVKKVSLFRAPIKNVEFTLAAATHAMTAID
jgi:hypothetical protein